MRKGLGSRAARWALAAGVLLSGVALAAEPPVVPGYNRLKDQAKAPPAELGQVLLGELNCAQCHSAPDAKRIMTKGAPDLSNAGARMTPQYIRDYLLNPHGMKPGATMPDLFHSSDPDAKKGAVEYLTQYLVSLGGPIKPSTEDGNTLLVDQGRALFQKIGCVACHAPDPGAATKVPSVPLPNLAEKTTVNHLEAFLLNPLQERPASRMPNLGLSQAEAHAMAVYLLRDQLTNPQIARGEKARISGIDFEYFEKKQNDAALEHFPKGKPKASGGVDHITLDFGKHKNSNFVVKFSGAIAIPRNGKYTFFTTSDDGSRIYIDGREILANDGVHPAGEKSNEVELSAGDHPIVVTYFQQGGEAVLKVEWSGPGVSKQEIPSTALFHAGQHPMVPLNSAEFSLDPQKAQMGGQMFAAMGCAACHQIPNTKSLRTAKPLAELDVKNDAGCLGARVDKRLPQYDLNDEQRQAMKAAISDKGGLAKAFEPKEQVVHMMAAVNCYACHLRDNVGGPTPDRAQFFTMTAEFDMGDEGKIPPRLNGVGAKLLPAAMDGIIFEGKYHIRPVLATRMPMWGKDVIGKIVDAFQQADSKGDAQPPAFNAQAAQDGRTLLGVKGFGCINCHGVEGVHSLGMPAPDLTSVHERLKYGWYKQWLDNPPAMVPGTRMPQFWLNHESPNKEIAGGTEDGQVAATWSYLSMGDSMVLPIGLLPGGLELVPGDTPLIHRTFMAGVGPRSILVGFPEAVHIAFDANGVKLAKAWRGKFFDAKGMWAGRGGQWLGPLGTDLIDLPPGPAIAVLEHSDSPWPEIEEGRKDEKFRNVGGHFKGYALDAKERPTFHYVLGDLDIQEQPLPIFKTAKPDLQRKFTISGKQPSGNLYFLAAAGKKIDQKSPGVWSVDNGKMTINLDPKLQPTVRDSNGQKQLLVPIQLTNGTASFDVEMSW